VLTVIIGGVRRHVARQTWRRGSRAQVSRDRQPGWSGSRTHDIDA